MKSTDRSLLEPYRPEFTPHQWSGDERAIIEAFATNPDGLVSVMRNLPPEIIGALCSRASRAGGSLLEVLMHEYIKPILEGEDRALAAELLETVRFLRDHGFRNILNNQRAQAFYSKWLSQYGDDSIAQLTGTHVILWGVSQVAMKFIEDQRIGLEPIEKSTRYVNFGHKVGGRYLYYTPSPDLERFGLEHEYRRVMDSLFDTYVSLIPRLLAHLKSNYDEKESILEKKAFDTLRGLLPMATLGQVALRGNAQSLEYLLNRSAAHPLGELRWLAAELKQELDKEIPSLLLRVTDEKSGAYQQYLHRRHSEVQAALAPRLASVRGEHRTVVRLVEFDPDAEVRILAAIIFPLTHESWDDALRMARGFVAAGPDGCRSMYARYLPERSARWYKVGRAFESAYLRFEIVMDIGSYRDLHRHRMMTQERQRFSTHHGYATPAELADAGVAAEFEGAMNAAAKLFQKIESVDAELAQYAVPLAYRVRFYQWQNFRQFFWETELRTVSQGHPDYRWIEQEKYRLVREKFPVLAEFVKIDMEDYPIARRGTEEKIAEKERMLLDRLKNRAES